MKLKDRLDDYYIFDEKIKPKVPKNMLIELTNMCNHSCIFCANSKMSRKKGTIDEKFLFHILNEAYDDGVREVGFYATGEPFISKDLGKYIAKAKEIGYEYVYITTNGALATPQRAREVIESGIDSIKFSINAGTRETYKIIHGKDDFETVIENLKYIAEYRKNNKKNFKIFVSYIATRYSANEKKLLEDKLGDIVDEVVFLNVRNQGGMMYEINDYLSLENDKSEEKMPCPLIFNSLHITYEGYLTACCVDFQNYLTVADLNKVSLKEAWHSDKFLELRKKHLEKSVEGTLCYNCIYNKEDKIEPLIAEHATYYDSENFNKKDEIISRVTNMS